MHEAHSNKIVQDESTSVAGGNPTLTSPPDCADQLRSYPSYHFSEPIILVVGLSDNSLQVLKLSKS